MAKVDQEKINYLLSTLRNMEYGSVVITVHDGMITQIDRTDKNRFISKNSSSNGKKVTPQS